MNERRRYIRLNSVFPVGFSLVEPGTDHALSEKLQGFTNNVGKGGICLQANNLASELAQKLRAKQAKLFLEINIPLFKKTVFALAEAVWIKEIEGQPNNYLIGLSYEKIDSCQNARIMHYTWFKKIFFPMALSIIIIFGIGLALNGYINVKLTRGNKALIEQLVKIIQESSVAKQKIKETNRQIRGLQLTIQNLETQLQTLSDQRGKLELSKTEEIGKLNNLIDKLSKEKESLQEKLIAVQHKENGISEELLRLDKKKSTLQKANIDKMYQWLRVHQNPHTGLLMSFEGDKTIAQWAFTYDQALAIQAYVNSSDFTRAKKILDFFRNQAKKADDLFLNAYYANDGSPAEYIVHSGPNIWLGIAILHYSKKSHDHSYMELAQDIAGNIIKLQKDDPEGGIRGGPVISWFSTEHNLDAYAFFNMLYKMTSKKEYLDARDKALKWLLGHTYGGLSVPVKRGKGDATVATDTYAWSIASLGPEKLEELGMNPEKIIEFAEENCAVEVPYTRPEGVTIDVKGFDFAPERNLARGGVISSEWTAQMVISFKIMAEFYYKKGLIAKARSYEAKADAYLSELGKMIISSLSPSGQGESCLPYATVDNVDTGHGWYTPKGKSTGSVAGTAYTIFAYYNYNPMEFKE